MEIVKYSKDLEAKWDQFLISARNGHFIFNRKYMEYHSTKYNDNSLLFFEDNQILSLFPANLNSQDLISHEGLTFGGFIINNAATIKKISIMFSLLIDYAKKLYFRNIIYKSIPYIYHQNPCQEDLYCLFINNAELFRRDLSATLFIKNPISYYKGRKAELSKAIKLNFQIIESEDYQQFFKLEGLLLKQKYNASSTHTFEEMQYLVRMFPENIKLFCVYYKDEILAGVILFIYKKTVHCQYIMTTELGRKLGGLGFLIDHLISIYKINDFTYFDFGTSNEKNGYYLNEGLIHNKESFGARGITHDFYRIRL